MEAKNNCLGGMCPGVYEGRKECMVSACPSVYEVRKVCGIGVCPSVHADEEHKDQYYVIGRQLNKKEIKDLGLAERVGKSETIIEVPKSLLEGI